MEKTEEGSGDKDEPVDIGQRRSRIAWDYSTLVKIFQPGNYARVIEIEDGKLLAVSGNGNSGGMQGTQMAISDDYGETWSEAKVIAQNGTKIKMAVPEIMKCQDGSLLLTYNPRPEEPYSTERKFGIRARKSMDNGKTWGEEIFVYDAQHTNADGCWEPFTLQLPSGEIQLFFANENDYQSSNEQNISMCRSFDGGLTWNGREIVSYRTGKRDGMPVAIFLEKTGEIIVAIEDNGYPAHQNRMQPSIIRTKDNWESGFVNGKSKMREYALETHLDKVDNAAAPYICKSPSGEILLSYQGTENRDIPLTDSGVKNIEFSQEMFVAVGDSEGRNFTNKSTPFRLPLGIPNDKDKGCQGMWNSIASLSNGEILAVSSITNAFGIKGGIFGIKGRLMNDILPEEKSVDIDGTLSEWEGTQPSIIAAHHLDSRLYGNVAKNGTRLCFAFKVTSGKAEENGFEMQLRSSDGEKGLSIRVPFDGEVICSEENILIHSRRIVDSDLIFECSVSTSGLERLGLGKVMPFNVTVFGKSDEGEQAQECLANSDPNDPGTWLRIIL
ncbi:MAG: exo-alpha-sialidase [Candidatus Cryptobacteroides sp.]